jgi:hypothetical protein
MVASVTVNHRETAHIRPYTPKNSRSINMSGKSNATPASMAHAPESKEMNNDPHAYEYPGVKAPKAEKVREVSYDQSCLAKARSLYAETTHGQNPVNNDDGM